MSAHNDEVERCGDVESKAAVIRAAANDDGLKQDAVSALYVDESCFPQ
jgi:hypothetical protein